MPGGATFPAKGLLVIFSPNKKISGHGVMWIFIESLCAMANQHLITVGQLALIAL
jgi:hypothetical protein